MCSGPSGHVKLSELILNLDNNHEAQVYCIFLYIFNTEVLECALGDQRPQGCCLKVESWLNRGQYKSLPARPGPFSLSPPRVGADRGGELSPYML